MIIKYFYFISLDYLKYLASLTLKDRQRHDPDAVSSFEFHFNRYWRPSNPKKLVDGFEASELSNQQDIMVQFYRAASTNV